MIWLVGYGSTSHVTGAHRFKLFKVRKNAKIRNRFSQVPYLTQYTVWESDKNTTKRHIQESQENSPFPAGDHNTARHRQDNMANTNTNKKKDPQGRRNRGGGHGGGGGGVPRPPNNLHKYAPPPKKKKKKKKLNFFTKACHFKKFMCAPPICNCLLRAWIHK